MPGKGRNLCRFLERGTALVEAHRRVRKAARVHVRALRVEVHKPADILGAYIYLPAAAGS